MTVVNGSFGFEQGWVHLDETTLIIDLKTIFPLLDLAFEITKPVAIMSLGEMGHYGLGLDDKTDKRFSAFSFKFKDWDLVEIKVPGLG